MAKNLLDLIGYRTDLQRKLDAVDAILVDMGHGVPPTSAYSKGGRPKGTTTKRKGKRKLSAAARKAIGDAARKRWAEKRKAKAD